MKDKKEKTKNTSSEKEAKKVFTRPVLTVEPISLLTEEVYAGWTPCSPDDHSAAFSGT